MYHKDLEPVIICGVHGGGTSFITKMLRASGLFVGHHIEPFEARKFHESETFRNVNVFVFRQLARDVNGMSKRFLELYTENYHHKEKKKHIFNSVENNLDKILKKYSNNNKKVFDSCWGWKDPRNSLTLEIWANFFPKCKVVKIRKEVDNNSSKSGSGHWFRNCSDYERNFYNNPEKIYKLEDLNLRTIHVQFEEITSKQDKFDELLEFCGLEQQNLDKILTRCSYEK